MPASPPAGRHPAFPTPFPPPHGKRAGLQGNTELRRIAGLPLASPAPIIGPGCPHPPIGQSPRGQRVVWLPAICSRLLPAKCKSVAARCGVAMNTSRKDGVAMKYLPPMMIEIYLCPQTTSGNPERCRSYNLQKVQHVTASQIDRRAHQCSPSLGRHLAWT